MEMPTMCTDLVVDKKKMLRNNDLRSSVPNTWGITFPENIECLYSFAIFKDEIKRP